MGIQAVMGGVVVRHGVAAPPAFALGLVQELKYDLLGGQAESQVSGHAAGEILALMMHESVDIAEANAQKSHEQLARKWHQCL